MLLKTEKTKTLIDQISSSVKVKITKPEPDALRSLFGEPVKTDEDGREFFLVPAHTAQYARETFPKYSISDEFLPDEEIGKLKEKSDENKKAGPSFNKQKKRGNPNWVKKENTEEEEDAINE